MTWLTAFARRNPVVIALLALLTLGAGVLALAGMPLQILPDVTFPEMLVVAADPGAGPDAVAQQVAQPLEQALAGVKGLRHIDTESDPGFAVVTLTFEDNADMRGAATDVDQALRRAELPPGLPSPTVLTASFNDSPVRLLALRGPDLGELSRLARDTVVPALTQVPGVGQVTARGTRELEVQVALDPAKLAAAGQSPETVAAAIAGNDVQRPAGTLQVGGRALPVQVSAGVQGTDAVTHMPLPPAVGAAATGAGAAGAAAMGPGAPGAGLTAAGAGVTGAGAAGAGTAGEGGTLGGRHDGGTTEPSAAASPAAAATPAAAPTVGDVATVSLATAPGTEVNVTDGSQAVLLTVFAASGGDQVKISSAIGAKLAELQGRLPAGYSLVSLWDNAGFIRDSVGGAEREALLGIAFAVVIIFLSLRVVRTTLVAIVSIPLSILAGLVVLSQAGITLNIMTLAGMAVAVGRVVDDSIVVIENVYRRFREEGARPGLVDEAVRDVAMAITTSTVTTVAVFAPLGLVTGPTGKIFRPFALAVVLALAASLVVALTVVPLLLQRLLLSGRAAAGPRPEGGRGREVYRRLLRWSLGHRWAVLLCAGLLFFGSLPLAARLGTEFLPQSGPGLLTVEVKMPAGTPLADTQALVQRLEQDMAASGLVEHSTATVGSSQQSLSQGWGFQGSNQASFFVSLKSGVDPASAAQTLRSRFGPLTPAGAHVTVSTANAQTGGANDYQVTLRGGDAAALAAQAAKVVDALGHVDGLVNVESNLGDTQPELEVAVRPADAAAHGLAAAQVAQQLLGLTSPVPVGTATVDGQSLPIVLTMPAPTPADLDAVRALPLASPLGPVRLGELADVSLGAQPRAVLRHDQQPAVTVSGLIVAANTGKVSADAAAALKNLSWPEGMTYSTGGITQQQNQAFGQLGLAMAAALAIVYVVMVLAFGGAAVPFAILFSLPLAVIGAVLGLWVSHSPIGLPALIGMLMLIGIVVTNAVVLVDLVQQKRRAGLPTAEALVEAGATRLRPILMTAGATIGALLPLAAGLSEGAIISQSLAAVVIGGLATSTLLTLVVVPVMYSLLQDKGPLPADASAGGQAGERTAQGAVAAALAAVAEATGRDGPGAGRPAEGLGD